MSKWHYAKNGHRAGPVSIERLRDLKASGELGNVDLVWNEQLCPEWTEARHVGALASAPPPLPSVPPPLPTTSMRTSAVPVTATSAAAHVNQPASHWKRIGAAVIDTIIVYVMVMVAAMILGAMGVFGDEDEGVATLVFFVMIVAYFALMPLTEKKATFGKMAVGLMVVSMKGERITAGQGIGRYLLLALLGMLFIPQISILVNRLRRGVHDLAAGTMVIDAKTYDAKAFSEAGPSSIPGGAPNGVVIMCIVLACAVPLIGILAAISIPAYQDYVVRARVTAAISEAAPVRQSIAAFFRDNPGEKLNNYGQIGLDGTVTLSDGTALDVSEDGAVLFAFGAEPLEGQTMQMWLESSGGVSNWRCAFEQEKLRKYLPSSCRST